MRRPVFAYFTLLSFLLAVALVVSWVRSWKHVDMLAVYADKARLQGWAGHEGKAWFYFSNLELREEKDAWTWHTHTCTPDEWGQLATALTDEVASPSKFLGFVAGKSKKDPWGLAEVQYSVFVVPYWAILPFLLILPLLWTRGVLRQWRRRRKGLCLTCGYDLRASEGTCPECGSAIPTRPAAA